MTSTGKTLTASPSLSHLYIFCKFTAKTSTSPFQEDLVFVLFTTVFLQKRTYQLGNIADDSVSASCMVCSENTNENQFSDY